MDSQANKFLPTKNIFQTVGEFSPKSVSKQSQIACIRAPALSESSSQL